MRNDLELFHMKEPLKWITVKYKGCFYSVFQLAMKSYIMKALKQCEFLNPFLKSDLAFLIAEAFLVVTATG